MKVLLVQPAEPFGADAQVPQSLIDIAAVLRQARVEVTILNAQLDNLSVAETLAQVAASGPDVLGITGLNNAYRFIKDLCIQAKQRWPQLPVMAGGHFIMSVPELILPRVPIDVACTGEADDIIVELATRLAQRRPLDGLHNIAYLRDGQLVRTEFKLVDDLDRIPLPAYDLLDMPRYMHNQRFTQWAREYFPVTTGRGCLYHCYYCGNPYRKVRRFSADRLLEHFTFLHDKYGITNFLFSEENAFYPKADMLALCERLRTLGNGFTFAAGGCAQHLDEELLKTMLASNFRLFLIAVEHWNPEIQKAFFRKTHSEHIMRVFELFRQYHVPANGFNVLWGHPRDTDASFRATYWKSVEAIRTYDIPTFSTTALIVLPNSSFMEDALARKKIVDFEDFMCSATGYGPYVNLTGEDDDVFKSFLVQRKTIFNLKLYAVGCPKLLGTLLTSRHAVSVRHWWNCLRKWLWLSLLVGRLAVIWLLMSLPKAGRRPFRRLLDLAFDIPMYDPQMKNDGAVNRYHGGSLAAEHHNLKFWRVAIDDDCLNFGYVYVPPPVPPAATPPS